MDGKVLVVTDQRSRKLPYSEDQNEYMPSDYQAIYSESEKDGFDPDKDILWNKIHELVAEIYKRKGVPCPVIITPYEELLGQTIQGIDGHSYLIDSLELYLFAYGIEEGLGHLYWLHNTTIIAAIASSTEEAEKFVRDHKDLLKKPEIRPLPRNTLISFADPIEIV